MDEFDYLLPAISSLISTEFTINYNEEVLERGRLLPINKSEPGMIIKSEPL